MSTATPTPRRPPRQNPADVVDTTAMTPLQQRQHRAREALARLRSPPTQAMPASGVMPIPRWTPDHAQILRDNIQRLNDATAEPVQIETESSDSDAIEEQPQQTPQGRRQRLASRRTTPIKRATPATTPSRGRKRRRNDDDDYQPGASDVPDPELPTADNQRALKRVKSEITSALPVPPECLADFRPQPLQFEFPPHPDEDRSDHWYIEEFRKLYVRLDRFCHDFYGAHDLDEGEFHQPWAIGMTPEFLRYVEQVAEADPELGGWNKLLRDTTERKWLVMAVLTRILEAHVFGADLFGADAEEKQLIFQVDRALITREGFERTALRAQTVRTIIGQVPITQNFHRDVATLTAQVSLLLRPLTDYLYSLAPIEGRTVPLMDEQYQELHNIMASAAYLSLCIRLSPTIFYFTDVSPNALYDPDDQHSVDGEAFANSKAKTVRKHDTSVAAWRAKRALLQAEVSRFRQPGMNANSRAGRKATKELADFTNPNIPIGRTHRALTKIGIWPNIRRFKPGSKEDDVNEERLADRDGFRIFELSKSAVLCYFGVESRIVRGQTRVPLEHFARIMQKRYGRLESVLGVKEVVFGTAVLAGCAYLGWVPACDFLPGPTHAIGDFVGQAVNVLSSLAVGS